VGLGTAALGGMFEAVGDEAAELTVEQAWLRGVRLFDTAPLYGLGLAESRLGRSLAAKPRDEYLLATKVGRLLRAGAPPDPDQPHWRAAPPLNPVFDFSYDGVLRSVAESLERLGLDRIDILHIHDPDAHHDEALGGAYRALEQLRSEGVIGFVGAGMNQVDLLVQFAREADFDCVLVAGRYTLLDQSALRELLPLCSERGIAVIAGGVFNSGILAGGSHFDYRAATPAVVERAQRLRAVCDRHGVPLSAAALQFPRAHPAVACVLLGSRSAEELDQCLDLLALPLPPELWSDLQAEGLLPPHAPVPNQTLSAERQEKAGS
jgi:D-threo-aldose 1-dehydrogenase